MKKDAKPAGREASADSLNSWDTKHRESRFCGMCIKPDQATLFVVEWTGYILVFVTLVSSRAMMRLISPDDAGPIISS